MRFTRHDVLIRAKMNGKMEPIADLVGSAGYPEYGGKKTGVKLTPIFRYFAGVRPVRHCLAMWNLNRGKEG